MLHLSGSCSCLLVFSFLSFVSLCPLVFWACSSLTLAYIRLLVSTSQTNRPFVVFFLLYSSVSAHLFSPLRAPPKMVPVLCLEL